MGALDPSTYQPDQSLTATIGRRLTQWKAAAPLPLTPSRPMISFTFDDFPISAAENGAAVVEAFNAKATFYACTGLSGLKTPLGEMFTDRTLETLSARGHQIAAHSHAHIDCSIANIRTIQADLTRNLLALRDYVDPAYPCHFAWPFGETQTDTKQELKSLMATARGILPGINRKGSDRVQLRSYAIMRDEWTVERAEKAIEKAALSGGWVILHTHDVQDQPSDIGTRPSTLRYLAKLARNSGLDIVSIEEAHDNLRKEMSLD
ncbi:MAG: polysaccharide deacetylase family protein [Pseudomonadota bacterium]